MNASHRSTPIMTPLHALWRWLMTRPKAVAHSQFGPPAQPAHSCTLRTQVLSTPVCASSRPAMRQPLRVLRVMDAGLAPAQIGRLRISGRMADVCAELDRLAAHEARYH
jgi:hypothetical protein